MSMEIERQFSLGSEEPVGQTCSSRELQTLWAYRQQKSNVAGYETQRKACYKKACYMLNIRLDLGELGGQVSG